jgi:predicted RNA methylase
MNSKIISDIDQLFHNNGIIQDKRFDVFFGILKKYNAANADGDNNRTLFEKQVIAELQKIDFADRELLQECFMKLCSNFTKYKLDQFYTPITIATFITNLMITSDDNIVIEPACGTGDLVLEFKSKKYLWDIDKDVLKLCEFNYLLSNNSNYKIECKNSLKDFDEYISTATYVVINPPFGSNTTTTDAEILNKFSLGVNKKKQELGILFIELGMKLLKDDGILFIILPAGYLGNKNKACSELRKFIMNYRVISSIQLPKNTFKRSGTGVNTYLLIIQKTVATKPYEIFISDVENIGYDLSKKNTPHKYKVNTDTGEIITLNGIKMIDNDLVDIYHKLTYFAKKNNIKNINCICDADSNYEFILSNKLDGGILDIKRYTHKYLSTIQSLVGTLVGSNNKMMRDLGKIHNKLAKIERNLKYKYIDIGEINTPFYGYRELYGFELPSRAKYLVNKDDIIISKLEGKISYTLICHDIDNLIVTNGVSIIRPNDDRALYIIFNNIIREHFKVQHYSLTTGSIMASLTDNDLLNMRLDCDETNTEITKKVIDTIYFFTHNY